MHNYGLILLTYKNKVLLMHKQKGVLDPDKHPWCLISAKKDQNRSLAQALMDRVKREMGIEVENVEKLSENYYHARLTDKNVNNIQRSEHQLLDFFTIKDLEKLYLSDDASRFISSYTNLINL
jgi:hypothetical protein